MGVSDIRGPPLKKSLTAVRELIMLTLSCCFVAGCVQAWWPERLLFVHQACLIDYLEAVFVISGKAISYQFYNRGIWSKLLQAIYLRRKLCRQELLHGLDVFYVLY